jgi:hypothetical protein
MQGVPTIYWGSQSRASVLSVSSNGASESGTHTDGLAPRNRRIGSIQSVRSAAPASEAMGPGPPGFPPVAFRYTCMGSSAGVNAYSFAMNCRMICPSNAAQTWVRLSTQRGSFHALACPSSCLQPSLQSWFKRKPRFMRSSVLTHTWVLHSEPEVKESPPSAQEAKHTDCPCACFLLE